MKQLLAIILVMCSVNSFYGQQPLSGNWQGVVVQAGYPIEQGNLFYLSYDLTGNDLTGRSREEIYETTKFAVKKIKGSATQNTLEFNQIVVEKSSRSSGTKWCRFSCSLTHDPITGYLTGDYKSTDCKRVIGKLILYRSEFTLSQEEEAEISHIWFDQFIKDYKEGLSAPEIRKRERDNFVFEPVFFDFDKATIRPEHTEFLNRLIKVVKGHSDLRVKVVGHTDSDGSDYYNDELSKMRAKAIVDYFIARGLSADRLEFDFRGEHDPIDTNNTSEGKQRNRRVDFSFI